MFYKNPRLLVIGLGVLTVIALGILLGLDAHRTYQRELEAVQEQLEADGRLLAEHAELSISAAYLILAEVQEQIRLRGVEEFLKEDRRAALERTLARAPQLSALIIADAQGTLRFSSSETALHAAVDVSDHAYFQAHLAGAAHYIGEPIIDQGVNRPFVPVTIRLTGPDGEFQGIVGAALDGDYFEAFYDRLRESLEVRIGMFRRDGTPLSIYPPLAEGIPPSTREAVARAFASHTSRAAVTHSPLDGTKRIIAFRDFGRHPLTVAVSIEYDMFLSRLYPAFLRNAIILAIFCCGSVLSVLLILRQMTAAAAVREAQLCRTIASKLPNGRVVVFDEKLRCVFADGSLPGTQQMIGKPLSQVRDAKAFALIEPACRSALAGAQAEVVVPLEGRIYKLVIAPLKDESGQTRFGLSLTQDITEQERLVAQLAKSEHLLDLFFSQNLDGCFFMMMDEPLRWEHEADTAAALDYATAHLRITRVNETMLAQYGAQEAQMLGQSFGSFFAHDPAGGRAALQRLFDAGRLHLETEERRLDGTVILVEGDYTCLYDEDRIIGLFGIQRDITARVLAEKHLKDSEARYRSLFENSVDGILLISPAQHAITAANPAACSMLGYSEQELIAGGLALMADLTDPATLASFDEAKRPEGFRGELLLLSRSGRFPAEVACREFMGELDGTLHCAVIRDITERKRAEQELAESRDKIRRLLASVQEVREQEQKRIARELHDELGQLTTALKLDVGWLKRRSDPAFVADKLMDLETLADAMRDCVRRLLSGLRPQLVDQVGLLAACRALLSDFTETSGIEHTLSSSHDQFELDERVAVAAYRILQEALTNVARHAGARQVRVSLVMQEKAELLRMSIIDDGRGFDLKTLRDKSGYGVLGIYERAQLLMGKAVIDSAPEAGTKVIVELPLHERAPSPTEQRLTDGTDSFVL
jgi:PAS domain S-box-containing protein